jgi:hypothetical protein
MAGAGAIAGSTRYVILPIKSLVKVMLRLSVVSPLISVRTRRNYSYVQLPQPTRTFLPFRALSREENAMEMLL